MDDLSAMLTQVMNNPDAMRQIQSMASSLGLGGAAPAQQAPAPQPHIPAAQPGGLDISALTALLQSQSRPQAPVMPPPPPAQQTPDLSALSALLQQTLGQSAQPQPPPPPVQQTPDLSSLLAMLGGMQAQPPQPAAPAGPNIDLNTLVKLSGAMSSIQSNRSNIDLLLALKPRLKEDRSKKVDDAIRVMQIVQFLPLVKESGLFGEMDNILGSIGNFIGGSGIGGLFGGGGGQGSGGNSGLLSGLLGNLGIQGRR